MDQKNRGDTYEHGDTEDCHYDRKRGGVSGFLPLHGLEKRSVVYYVRNCIVPQNTRILLEGIGMEQPVAPQSAVIAEPVPSMGEVPVPPKAPLKLPSFSPKKIMIGAASALVVVILVIGATFFLRQSPTPPTQPSRQISLVYWGMMQDTPVLRSVLKDFEVQNPGVSVQYSYQSPKEYSERLVSACGRGQCPDLFRFHSTWVPQYLSRGLLSVAPPSVSKEVTQSFYPVMSADLQTPSGVVGVPLMYDGLGLFINKRILQDAGRQPPTTWDELRSLARDVTVRNQSGGIERSGVALGTATNVDHFSDIIAALILQNGGNPLKPEVITERDVSEGKNSLVGDALTFYTQFSRSDKVWDETMPNSTYAFAIGRVAMVIAPAYRAAEIKKLNPNFEFGVYPIPQLPGKPVTVANYWAEGVSKSSKEQEMAWKLLTFLSQKNTLAKLYPIGADQLMSQVYPRSDMAETILTNPYAGAIVKTAATSKSFPMSSRTFDNALNDKMIAAYQAMVTKMQSGVGYTTLCSEFATTVGSIAQSYGATVR